MKLPYLKKPWEKFSFWKFPKLDFTLPKKVSVMEITIERVNSESNHTNGLLYIDGKLQCFTLEDEAREVKVWGETCIPIGKFKIELRTVGGFHLRYLKKYGSDFHKGMLWLRQVPGFEYILIHVGNDDKDTAGCILVGTTTNAPNNFIGGSIKAYKKIYPIIRDHILNGGEVWITVKEKL